MATADARLHHRSVPQPLPITSKARKTWSVDLDGPIRWGCSGKGWNCCVDVGIAVRPYDMVRLRHAAGRPAHELVSDATVTFEWEPASGVLLGRLAHRPYEQGSVACVFLEEVTNLDARRIRDEDPGRFEALPPAVQRAAEGRADREWKVAGLCGVHSGRPEVCRGFPYQRLPARDGSADAVEIHQGFRCGSCAHATPTTPRAVLAGEGIEHYWRADEAFRELCRYLHAHGLANSRDPAYRHLLPDETQRLEFWAALYLPDSHPRLAAAFGDQWRTRLDVEGDATLYRALLDDMLVRVEALIAESGRAAEDLGMPGDAIARPDLDALLDPDRELLPAPASSARQVT